MNCLKFKIWYPKRKGCELKDIVEEISHKIKARIKK